MVGDGPWTYLAPPAQAGRAVAARYGRRRAGGGGLDGTSSRGSASGRALRSPSMTSAVCAAPGRRPDLDRRRPRHVRPGAGGVGADGWCRAVVVRSTWSAGGGGPVGKLPTRPHEVTGVAV